MKLKEMTQEIAEKIAAGKYANYGAITFFMGDVELPNNGVSRRVIVRGVDCYDGIVEIIANGYYC